MEVACFNFTFYNCFQILISAYASLLMSCLMGLLMYYEHFSIFSLIWCAVELYIFIGLYGTYLLDLCLAIALIIPTMALSFCLLIADCIKLSPNVKCSFSYSFFLEKYHNVIHLLLKSNDTFFENIGLVLIYDIPINAFVVTYLTNFSVSEAQRILLMLIVWLQLIGILLLLAGPVISNKKVMGSTKHFQTVLSHMDNENGRLKWKYLTQLEFTHFKPQVGYTLTPYGAITFSLIIEVCIQTIVPNKFYSFCLNFFSYWQFAVMYFTLYVYSTKIMLKSQNSLVSIL